MSAWLTAHVMRSAGAKTQPADVNPYTKGKRKSAAATIKVPVRALRSIFCG